MKKHITEITVPLGKGPTAKWSYISLLFSSFFFLPLIVGSSPLNDLNLAAVLLIYLCFIGAFFWALFTVGNKTALPIVGIITICAAGSYIYVGTNALFGYGAFLSSYYFKLKSAFGFLMGNLASQIIAAYAFDLLHIYFLGPSIAITVALFIYGHFSRNEALNGLNNKAQAQQMEQLAAIAERERIARDMHDLLGHSLSSLALKSELAEKLLQKGNTEQAQQEITEVAALSRTTLSEVRQAVTGLKLQSFRGGIEKLSEQLQRLGFRTEVNISTVKVDASLESTLLMLCKEWVTNILRHSNGNFVNISVEQTNNQIELEISDNGLAEPIKPGNGIQGMQSRVKELKGKFAVNVNEGVTMNVVIPC